MQRSYRVAAIVGAAVLMTVAFAAFVGAQETTTSAAESQYGSTTESTAGTTTAGTTTGGSAQNPGAEDIVPGTEVKGPLPGTGGPSLPFVAWAMALIGVGILVARRR
jgi:MYXO-CTERM domain-containing protein